MGISHSLGKEAAITGAAAASLGEGTVPMTGVARAFPPDGAREMELRRAIYKHDILSYPSIGVTEPRRGSSR